MNVGINIRRRVFVAYARKDSDLREQLEAHLIALKRDGLATVWHDGHLGAGMAWRDTVLSQLEAAEVVLLLITKDFLASEFCYGVEMTRALARHDASTAKVVPVICRPCDWTTTPFAKLQAVPTDARPVVAWPDPDDAWLDVALQLRASLNQANMGAAPPQEPIIRMPEAFAHWLSDRFRFAEVEWDARVTGKMTTEPYDVHLHAVRRSSGWRAVSLVAGIVAAGSGLLFVEGNVTQVATIVRDATGISSQATAWAIVLFTLVTGLLAYGAWRKAVVHAWVAFNESELPVTREDIGVLHAAIDDVKQHERASWKPARIMMVSAGGFTEDALGVALSYSVECYQPGDNTFKRLNEW